LIASLPSRLVSANISTLMNARLLHGLVLILLIAQVSHAETFTCTEDIGVFDAATPDKQIGQFNVGTKLSIIKPATAPGMYHVSFLGTDGKFISGLCRAEDIGKAPKSSTPSGPKPVIVSKTTKRARSFEWLDDYDKASEYARDEKKLLLMDFTGSDWCGWCIKLEREVFDTPEFKNYAEQNLVLLRVDFPHNVPLPARVQQQNQGLKSKYTISGYPTIIVLNSQGQQVGKLGYMEGGPSAFIARLKQLNP
jgi:protein disulfide-isomerase